MNGPPAPVGGIVVTYFPDGGFEARVAAMAREVAVMVVVDNSADPEVSERLDAWMNQTHVRRISLPRNQGLGAALNVGFAALKQTGCEWIVAFDQDSMPLTGCVNALLRAAAVQPRAAVIGSNWQDEAQPGVRARHLVHGCGFLPWFRRVDVDADIAALMFVITSGSLFRVAAWNALGGFREDLFLDLVDTEYCVRAGARRWRIGLAACAHLRHRRGDKQAVQWCGHTWWPAHMPPRRIHLLLRNRVWALVRFGWTRWPWALFELSHTAFVLFSILCLERDTTPKLAAFLRGAWDGLRGRLGAPAWARTPTIPTSASADQTTPS